jgi:hypothetical protein
MPHHALCTLIGCASTATTTLTAPIRLAVVLLRDSAMAIACSASGRPMDEFDPIRRCFATLAIGLVPYRRFGKRNDQQNHNIDDHQQPEARARVTSAFGGVDE